MVCCCSSATNPELKRSTKVEHGFKVTSDGRLIIREDDNEEKEVKNRGKRTVVLSCAVILHNIRAGSDGDLFLFPQMRER